MNGRTTRRRRWRREPYQQPELIHKADYSIVAFVVILAVTLAWLTNSRPQTHAVYIDIPVTGVFDNSWAWERQPDEEVNVLSPKADGSIEWNGQQVGYRELVGQLHHGLMQPVEPLVVFAPDAFTNYDLAARVLAIVKASGVTKFCFADLEDHQHFNAESVTYQLNLIVVPPEASSAASHPVPPRQSAPQCSLPAETPS